MSQGATSGESPAVTRSVNGTPRSDLIPSRIPLQLMPQQAAVHNFDEVWTGLTDAAKRRKLQNRLNQRARRRRQAEQEKAASKHATSSRVHVGNSSRLSEYTGPLSKSTGSEATEFYRDLLTGEFVRSCIFPGSSEVPARFREMLLQVLKWSENGSTLGSPATDCLLTLVRFNMYRAIVSNTQALGFTIVEIDSIELLSPFNEGSTMSNSLAAVFPPSLRPTPSQRAILHHPWLDLFPVPRMRDNLIQAGDWDELAMCRDLMGHSDRPNGLTGIAIWGEAWDASQWELTEQFIVNWLWAIKGCGELLISTNYWRAKRGEPPVYFE
ncbi:hypothetical protein BP5796_09057 [Coleophoma crateriformis]|uniref:BZIP domain-containing protein n=1 Tax=Coleophoma crateriformis TaxID=565419 RepID=A0A3D8R373_9HELO|nr:hypothetical protein BP5796_09057 [Coleophoma crateriformis]